MSDAAHPLTPQELAAAIRALDALPVTSKRDLTDWYARAQLVLNRLKACDGVGQVSNDLWDWFSDRDIRFKDPAYAQHQAPVLVRVLAALDAGRWDAPEDGENAPKKQWAPSPEGAVARCHAWRQRTAQKVGEVGTEAGGGAHARQLRWRAMLACVGQPRVGGN